MKKNFIILKINKVIYKLFKFFNLSIKLKYRYFSILLPADHSLIEFKMLNINYDRFLPYLVSYLDHSDTIIDIGANVGDTLASMIEQNSKPNYICIEADDYFYSYLKKNLTLIKKSIKNAKVQLIKAFIGKNINNIFLKGQNGTKKAVININGNIKSVSLDEVITNISQVRILKTDTDGFDYDALIASMKIIKKNKPLLFFEYYYNYNYQKIGYSLIFKSLQKLGYCNWVVFDNFGTVILRTNNLKIINQLINYYHLQNIGKATRTVFCFDILTFLKKDSKLINKVIKNYHPQIF
jgi:FkbM family methyltransferase